MFLFDEPLSNLDAKLRTEMRLEIKKLHDELKSTIVYVTHDQIEAMTMATKIAVMDAGVIQQFGTPDEIYERPANLFVARFIGSPAMNILDGAGSRSPATAIVAVHAPTGVEHRPLRLRLRAAARRMAQPVAGRAPARAFRGRRGRTAASRGRDFELPVQYTEKTGGDATAFLAAGDELARRARRPARRRRAAARARPSRPAFRATSSTSSTPQTGRRM